MTFTAETELAKSIQAMAPTGGKIRDVAVTRSDMYQLNPFSIKVEEGFNTRNFDGQGVSESLNELARSIAEVGVKRPLLVRRVDSEYVLVDGERRLRATMIAINEFGAEIRSVPVLLAPQSMNDADAALSIVLQNDGVPLTLLERGNVYKRLANFGWSPKQIADSVGSTQQRVQQLIDLTGVPMEVQDMIVAGEMSASLALEIATENNFERSAILETVAKAKTNAEKAGRAKVTAKSVDGKVNFKKAVVGAFASAVVEDLSNDGDEDTEAEVMIVMSKANFEAIKELLKIDIAVEDANDTETEEATA